MSQTNSASSTSSSNSLATWVFAIHRSLSELGHDADQIMREVGFEFSSLSSTTQRVPKETLNAIWKAAETITQDDAFCISTFPYVNDPYLNALITSAQSSGSVQQAIQLLLRYYPVVTSSLKLEFKLTQQVELHILPVDATEKVSSQDVDLVFGLISKYGSVLSVKEINPLAVFLERTTPNNIDAYRTHFDCPIEFEAGRNEIHFPIEILNAEIPSANPALSNHVEQYLAEQTALAQEDSLATSVEKTIKRLLQHSAPKLKDVALALNISERTLQRRLKQEKLSFTHLLNKVRMTRAKELLAESSEPIQNIAYQLGFTEPGNFIRFFKSQTGITPNNFAKSCTK